MSKLVLNHNKSNLVFINDYGDGQFQIKGMPENVGSDIPILFKVMTNIKLNVTLSPTQGVLMSHGEKNKTLIKVKFNGSEIEMNKAKIQIRWISLNSSSQLFPELQSVLIFTDFYRKSCGKYKEQRIELTLQNSNQHNIEVIEYNLKVAKEKRPSKYYEPENEAPSAYMKNEEGDVFQYVYLKSNGLSQNTINILKRNNIKSLKQLKKSSLNGLMQAQISLEDFKKLEQLINK